MDKAGCISFDGKKYEVGVQFTGYRVDVVYDPSNTKVVTIEYESYPPFTAKEIQIGESTGKKPKLPEQFTPKEAEESRLLKATANKNIERKEQVAHAISYSSKFEPFYEMNQTPFSRNIPPERLYPSVMLEEAVASLCGHRTKDRHSV